jgi:uncharacterized membrane protein
MSHVHYLPLAPGFFAILVGFFFIVLILRSVRYAYESLGVSSNTAIFLLLATLIGSFFNIPITELPPERAISHHVVDFFGMRCEDSAPLAYIAGSLGTLIGADLTNLSKVRGLGAPVASIGGAGTFDGIFLTGILAVLLASLYARPRAAHAG